MVGTAGPQVFFERVEIDDDRNRRRADRKL